MYDKLETMKIIIATPLYPPEIAESAQYSKRLAEMLTEKGHDITIITYSLIPEKIDGVKIIKTNKHSMLPVRLVVYTKKLWNAVKNTDIIYAQNGASIELPLSLISFFTKKPIVIHIGDKLAYEYAQKNKFFKFIQYFAFKRSCKIIGSSPLERPEILPFKNPDTIKKEQEKYNLSWKKHIQLLMKTFEECLKK